MDALYSLVREVLPSMFMQIGTSTLEELKNELFLMLAKPKFEPLEAKSSDNLQKVIVKSPLLCPETWSLLWLECEESIARNWYEFQNEVLMQMYAAHCSRGNVHTGGCLQQFYLELGERERFGPANTGGRHGGPQFKGIFGMQE